jgi:hypothetical protein
MVRLSNCFSFSKAHDSNEDINPGKETDLFHSMTGAFKIIKNNVEAITNVTGNAFILYKFIE